MSHQCLSTADSGIGDGGGDGDNRRENKTNEIMEAEKIKTAEGAGDSRYSDDDEKPSTSSVLQKLVKSKKKQTMPRPNKAKYVYEPPQSNENEESVSTDSSASDEENLDAETSGGGGLTEMIFGLFGMRPIKTPCKRRRKPICRRRTKRSASAKAPTVSRRRKKQSCPANRSRSKKCCPSSRQKRKTC